MSGWHVSFEGILALHQSNFVAASQEMCRAEEELLQDEPEDATSSLSPEEREAAAHPKDAAFYKKEEEQAKLGVKNEIKHRTGHARDWFKNMTPAQWKEVENAREKWNKEGAPLESQTMPAKDSSSESKLAGASSMEHRANLAESDSSEDESAAAASMGHRTMTATQPSSAQQGAPATVLIKNQIQFLKSLSSNNQYLL
ncbi:hypothetical protein BDR07DRAFT_1477168 [Suillus spraguei]|nr:hypothetical protein BDR07DRAFT_1477168 [Suillus spraguei]